MPYVLAKIALSKDDRESALTYFKEAASKTTDVFEIYHELGKLQVLQTNEYTESIQHLSVALGIKKYTDIYLHRALAYCKVGEATNANKDIESYISEVEPYNNSMLVSAGYLLSDAGYSVEAHTFFSAALEKNLLFETEQLEKRKTGNSESSLAFHDNQLAQNTKRRSRIYTGLSITATSVDAKYKYASNALSLEETDPNLLYNMGVALYDQGKMAEAEQYYDRALALNGNLITALNNKSIIRLQQKDYEAALLITDQILNIDNTHAEAFSTKATIAYFTGDLSAALKYYEEYLARNPSSGKGQYGVGFIYTHLREDKKAIPYLLQAIELSSNNPQLNEMYSNLANCYNNTSQLAAGIEAAEQSITINPNYYHPYYILACIYKKENRDNEALEMVKKVLQLDPSQRHQIINEPDLATLKEKMKTL
jgi:tetratricopeptide (TPR) repeat protein